MRPNVRLRGNESISRAIFACGALHWLVDFIEYEDELQCETKILSFDVCNEKSRDIALPEGVEELNMLRCSGGSWLSLQ